MRWTTEPSEMAGAAPTCSYRVTADRMRVTSCSGRAIVAIRLPSTRVRTPKANEVKPHERLIGGEAVEDGSERGFGIVFALVFAAIGLFPMLDGRSPRGWHWASQGRSS